VKKILTLALLTFLLSCKKNDTAQKIALNGTWEYRGITCFCIRDSSMNDGKPGNGNIINFNNDSYKRFIKIYQNKLTFFGTTPIAADGTEIYYEKQ